MILIFLKNLQDQKDLLKKKKKVVTLKNEIMLLNGRQKVLNAFEIGIFPKTKKGEGLTSISDCVARVAKVSNRKVFNHKQLEILTLKQMFQRLPIVLAQVKVVNTSENLLNEIRQITHSLYRAKQITKKLYNNILNSIKF